MAEAKFPAVVAELVKLLLVEARVFGIAREDNVVLPFLNDGFGLLLRMGLILFMASLGWAEACPKLV